MMLFISTKCKYSLQLLETLKSNDAVFKQFTLVNVNNPNYKIPSFVDRVPMIFLKNSSEVIIDEDVDTFVKQLLSEQRRNQGQRQSQGQNNDDVEWKPLVDTTKGFTDHFSFLEGSDCTSSKHYINIENQENDLKPMNTSIDDNKVKFDQSSYDQFLSQRDLDNAQFNARPKN